MREHAIVGIRYSRKQRGYITKTKSENMAKVSVYIPCFNVQEYIQECIESLYKQTYPVDEILIIDDGCTDDTVKIAALYPVKIIRHEKNRGLACARNSAVLAARNEFIASVDADCIAMTDWLQILMSAFTEAGVAGAGGMLIEKKNEGIADTWRNVHMKQDWGAQILENPRFLYGNNGVYRTALLKHIGLYSLSYNSHYEDVDVSFRLKDNGYQLKYIPQAKVYHMRHDTITTVLNTFWKWTFFDMPEPSSLGGFLKKAQRTIRLCLRSFQKDAGHLRLTIIIVDVLLLYYFLKFDFRYYRKRVMHEHGKGSH